MPMSFEIVSINIGKPFSAYHKGKEVQTGIFKSQVTEPIYLGKLNFVGDGQADLIHHGGKEKAVCVYSYEHYPYWEKVLNRKLIWGAFGENLTVTGMLERDVCLGDIYKLGEAVVQISQPRQPCFKLAIKYDLADLPVRFQHTGYTGFYFRVLEEGLVSPDSDIELIQPHPHNITVAYANQIMHHDKANMEGVRKILEVNELSKNWRATFLKRLAGIEVDTKARLEGMS